ncbi:hypothetical protein D3C80_2211140 [compost metagenome]
MLELLLGGLIGLKGGLERLFDEDFIKARGARATQCLDGDRGVVAFLGAYRG